jgi:hypothetical protein
VASAKQPANETPTEPVVAPSTRLADLAGGMGKKIADIKGRQVTVEAITFDTRQVRALKDEDPSEEHPDGIREGDLVVRNVATITVTQPADAAGDYYTFSDPLIDKLRRVNAEDLPAVAIFNLVDIDRGQRVWTIE